jgi:hypothetical protein
MPDQIDPMVIGEAGATAESEAEKKRRQWRESKQKQRRAERQEKVAKATESEREWFERNRASLPPAELASLEKLDAEVRELLVSMKSLQGSDEELVKIVVDHVKENGTAHLGYITRASREIIPADWPSVEYWKNPELLAALEAESDSTATFIRFGLLTALIDWNVQAFLIDKAGWTQNRTAELLGYVEVSGVGYLYR